MRSITDKHTLSWGWDDIKITDANNEEIHYWALSMFFETDITIRGKENQEEILITFDMSPMTITGATNNWFPFQVKGTWDLIFLTLN